MNIYKIIESEAKEFDEFFSKKDLKKIYEVTLEELKKEVDRDINVTINYLLKDLVTKREKGIVWI